VAVTADAEYVLEGLEGPAEVLIDRWGVPHMYASTLYDVFRVQGFNAARDRLWQLDFWRRRGLGLLAEVFGPSMVERDRASRLFYYRGDMQPEWLSYGSDTKRVATAFVEGVNAWIRLALQDRELLAPEFRQLGYEPAMWAAEDFARIRSNGLYYNLDSEVARALILRDYDPRVEELRRRREPPVGLVVPEGLDLSVIPHDVQRVYRLAIDPPDLSQAREAVLQGSNNWVLAPERTTTGRPLLANDPHRALSVPSLRYLAHLSAPGLDVIGAGEPALPGISIGHNGRVAFGFTIFSVDQEDLYVYETNPQNPSEYLYERRWESMEVEKQQISVKGEKPAEVKLKYTRHGPVIPDDRFGAAAITPPGNAGRTARRRPRADAGARNALRLRQRDADPREAAVRDRPERRRNARVASGAAARAAQAPAGRRRRVSGWQGGQAEAEGRPGGGRAGTAYSADRIVRLRYLEPAMP
jgi:penicillin amidase